MLARGNSLAVQWLSLQASNAGGEGSILGQGTKIPPAEWHGQKNKQVLARMWRNWTPFTSLVGIQNGTGSVENNMAVPQKIKHDDPAIPFMLINPEELKTGVQTKSDTRMFKTQFTKHYSTKGGNTSNIHQLRNAQTTAQLHSSHTLVK